MATVVFGLALVALGAGQSPASSQCAQRIINAVPADAMAVFFAPGGTKPQAASGIGGPGGSWSSVLGALSGPTSTWGQVIGDLARVLPALGEYDRAVALLDVSSRAVGDNSYRLEQFKLAIIIDTGGQNQRVLKLIKGVLDGYFSRDDSQLTWCEQDSIRWQRLSSGRLPAWCNWQWGSLGRLFVFAVGQGAFEQVVQAYVGKRGGLSRKLVANGQGGDGGGWLFTVYLNIDRLAWRLRPVVGQRIDTVIGALDAEGLSALSVKFARVQKEVSAWAAMDWGSKQTYRQIGAERCPMTVVPAGARSYSCLRVSAGRLVRSLTAGYLGGRNPNRAAKLREGFTKIEELAGVKFDSEVLEKLGGFIIIHDWPAHPLNWPLAFTIVIPHSGGQDLARRLTRLAQAGAVRLARGKNDQQRSWWDNFLTWQIGSSSDGIWFVHLGPMVIASGAATDRYVVISFSPQAVRLNLQLLSASASGSGPSRPASVRGGAPGRPNRGLERN